MADTSSASVAASTLPDVSITTANSTSGTPAPIAQFAKVHGRMPSLTQLAARMGTEKPSATSVSSRPRLATTLLRTGSSVSLATNDSLAVNAPTTRSGSPSNITASSRSTSPARSASGTAAPGGDDQLTAEKLEKLNTTDGTEKEKKVQGYKNTPSLEAITARLGLARSLSIDGSAKPPEPETFEDPKTPGVPQKAEEHRLQYQWTIYHDSKAKFPYTPSHGTFNGQQVAPVPAPVPAAPIAPVPVETDTYEAGLTVVGDFNTVESFCRYFNWLKPPSQLERNSNYHLFKSGIKPMWEDPANATGGKWVLTMKNSPQLLDRCWSWLAMGLVGQELEDEDEICGAVVSLRSKVDRIQVWIRSKDDVEKVNSIGKKLVKILDVSEADGIGLEFQYNSDDRPPPNKFLSIHASFPQSGFRSSFTHGHGHSGSFSGDGSTGPPNSAGLNQPAPQASAGGGAFGAFGNAGGGFSGGWRGRK